MSESPALELAALGGPKAVTVEPREHWPIPTEAIKAAVGKLIDDEVFTEAGSGITADFENRFAAYTGSQYCLAQSSGTSTLWSAYYAIGIKPGDEVLHPAYTWIASIAPAVHLGARPVFCEIDPHTLTLDPEDAERRITPRTKAISLVHVHGNVCDMDAVMALAERHGLDVIEDCSHATGAEWNGKKVGSIGTVGCFSMQGHVVEGKPLAAGESGAVITNRRDLYERMLFFGHVNRKQLVHGFSDPAFKRMAPYNSGLKFRPHPWPLALAMVMFDSLDERNEKRRAYRQRIYEGVDGLPGVSPLVEHPQAVPAGFFGGMHVLYEPQELGGLPLSHFLDALRAEGVAVRERAGYELTHRLPQFAEGYDFYGTGGPLTGDYPGYPEGSLPRTEDLHARMIGMPTFIEETPGYSEQVVEAFRKVVSRYASLQTPKARLRRFTTGAKQAAVGKAKRGLRRIISR